MLSIGSDGGCLVWRHWNEMGERELSEEGSDTEEERAARRRHVEEIREEGPDEASGGDGSDEAFSMSKANAKDRAELRALPPWRRTLGDVGASGGGDSKALEEEPTLAWVHGYRGHDCRQNVFFSAAGEAVYPAAAVIVLSGIAAEGGRRKQRFFMEHTDDVLCLAAHPDRVIFASGQKAFASGGQGKKASILVWDSVTLKKVAELKGLHEHAVTCLAFSSGDGRRLLSSGLDQLNSVAMWDWQKGTMLLQAESSPRPLLGLAFLMQQRAAVSQPATTTVDATDPSSEGATGSTAAAAVPSAEPAAAMAERLVVCGERELRFGQVAPGVALSWRKAVFGSRAEMQTLPCVAVNTDGRVLTGTWRGELYAWQHDHNSSSKLWRRFDAHAGPLQSIAICHEQVDGAGFATGGADGAIILWNVDYEKLRHVDLNALCKRSPLDVCGRPCLLPPTRGVHVRAVCWDPVEGRVLAGTESNEVVRIQLRSGGEEATILTQGHQGGMMREGEWRCLRSLAEHPQLPRFATAGDDGAVKLWSLSPHKLHAARRLRCIPRCLSYSPDGEHLAVGCDDGSLAILSAELLQVLVEVAAPPKSTDGGAFGGLADDPSCACIAYSPDGRLLAVGDGRRTIRLYLVKSSDGSLQRAYRMIKVCTGHTGAVTSLGWSADSSCLRTNCDTLELRRWDSDGVELEQNDKRLEKLEWASSDGGALFSRETAGFTRRSKARTRR